MIFLITGLISLILGIILMIIHPPAVPWVITIGMVLISTSFRYFDSLKGFSFTVWILTAVTISLFFPELFINIGGFSLKSLIVPLLQLIMFGVGSTMGLKDFEGVIRMPKAVIIGLACQFTIMPVVGFSLTKIFNFPPEVAAGIILVGCVPSGLASNVMSFIAKANVALSVTLTAVATLLSPIITPFLMQQFAGSIIKVEFVSMMVEILKMVILPVAGGLVFNHFLGSKLPWLNSVMPKVSMISIAAIITIITAAGRDSLLEVGPLLGLACLLHNLSGYLLGYYSGRLLRMDESSCRTIAIEVGLQNGGLASGLAISMGKMVALAPAIFGPLMNITGSILASFWKSRAVKNY